MKIVEHIGYLHAPLRDSPFIYSSAHCGAHSRSKITTGDVLHHEVEPAQRIVVEVIVDCWNRRVLESRQQQRLAFEITDCFLMLRRIEVRLDHLFDCARCITEIAILREIDSAHATAADPAHDLIATIQNCIRSELLDGRSMTTGRPFSPDACASGCANIVSEWSAEGIRRDPRLFNLYFFSYWSTLNDRRGMYFVCDCGGRIFSRSFVNRLFGSDWSFVSDFRLQRLSKRGWLRWRHFVLVAESGSHSFQLRRGGD